MTRSEDMLLWSPPINAWQSSRLGHFLRRVEERHGLRFGSHETAWTWSVQHLDDFWSEVVDDLGIRFQDEPSSVFGRRDLPAAEWFPGTTLNYADNLLVGAALGDSDSAVVSLSQTRGPIDLSLGDLRLSVMRCQAGLRRLGVRRGDRVVGYLPNIVETLVAMLATASVGAIWSCCPPEFGARAVIDRFSQIEPSVLITTDGYVYGSKRVDRSSTVEEIRIGLPSLQHTVSIAYLDKGVAGALEWADLVAVEIDGSTELTFDYVPFDHPLYVLYSSGTTGLPKALVHSHGGITLEHAMQLAYYWDLGPQHRFFWFTTTGWMMWNYLVSGLMVGAPIVLWDGDPSYPSLDTLWRLVDDWNISTFGASAPYLMTCMRQRIEPHAVGTLASLRAVGSTGAPLPAEGFRWVYESVKGDVMLSSISGGTDVCAGFVGGSPLTPVHAGVIGCRYLGCSVAAFDEAGSSVVDTEGELVITSPMPSMPVGLWGDDDGSRYQATYYSEFPNVWRHGDWITIHEDGTCVISGRSDATLNRGGVRLGTGDFYSAVESLIEIVDSLVVHLEEDGSAGELLLFVVVAPGVRMDDGLRSRIRGTLRSELSPRHLPDRIETVPSIPRTLSGKKLEVPVKRILCGVPVEMAVSRDSLSDPGSLAPFQRFATLRRLKRMGLSTTTGSPP